MKNIQNAQNRFVESQDIDYESEDEDFHPSVQIQIDQLRCMMEKMISVEERQHLASVSDQDERDDARTLQSLLSTQTRDSPTDTLPEYDPGKDSVFSVDQFIDRVNKAMHAYEWEDKYVLLAVRSKLKGPAKLCLDASKNFFMTWISLANAMRDEFGTEPEEADVCFKMSSSTRRHCEPISEYCFRMTTLGLSESAIVKYTREGLKHNDLQSAIAALSFKTMKQMRETVEAYMTNMASCSVNRKSVSTTKRTYSDGDTRDVNKTADSNVRKPTTQGRPIVCFNCNEAGHVSSSCTKPQRRVRCRDCQRVYKQRS